MAITASFDVDIANEFGIPAALLLSRIAFLSKYTPREDGFCWRTSEELRDELALGEYQIRDAIKKLTKAEVLEVKNTYIMGTMKKCRHFRVTDKGLATIAHIAYPLLDSKPDSGKTNESEAGKTNESLYIDKYKTVIKDNNDYDSGDEKDDFCKEVIDHLNAKIGSRYKPTSQKTKKLINARRKEGFALEDFKTVIDKKCESWLNDPEISKYLRPETLFGTKFESYLNEVHATKTYFTADAPSEGGEGWLNKVDLKAWGMQ